MIACSVHTVKGTPVSLVFGLEHMQCDRSAIVSGVVRCTNDHDVANARIFRQNMNIQTLHIAVVITVATTSDAGDNIVGEVSSSKVSGEPGTILIHIFELENRSVTQCDFIIVNVNVDDCFTCSRRKKAPASTGVSR